MHYSGGDGHVRARLPPREKHVKMEARIPQVALASRDYSLGIVIALGGLSRPETRSLCQIGQRPEGSVRSGGGGVPEH